MCVKTLLGDGWISGTREQNVKTNEDNEGNLVYIQWYVCPAVTALCAGTKAENSPFHLQKTVDT